MAKDMERSELNLMLSIVRKYYELGMNQEQIAEEEFISKSSVCRLIKKAQKNGLVKFQINYPIESIRTLEKEFHEMFELDKVFITPAYTQDADIRLQDTCRTVAGDLCKIIKADDIVGVSWGTTMEQIANITMNMQNAKKCSKVVLMNGSLAGDIGSTKSSQIVEQFSQCFNAQGFLLPVPLVVDNCRIAEAIQMDSHVKYVLDMARNAQLSVVSIGAVSYQSVLRTRSAYTKAEYDEIVALGAVGDIAGRCFDINGKEVGKHVMDRLIGLKLNELNKKKVRIGVAVGNHKVNAIIGALRGGLINRFYTDEVTAQEVIRIFKNMQREGTK
ncbi:MAG: sugar-binding domain-containing protein [Christensenella sp.]|uniref:sugar-binding transcriptional regulator n=1 Tax=Christensenella sp. TaxID=1935934 RepID=UPI002B20271F|nr:sugar-binding domain-containing protein [Christensenella sp.]MEA5003728.1 sugar-binding domain-containing protein [Christensenella sp.]